MNHFLGKIQTLNWIRLGIAHPYAKTTNCCSPEDVPINATCEAGNKALPDRGPVPQEVRQHWQVTEVDCRFLFGSKHGIFRFGSIPDLIELDHLTVSGDVTFGRGVSQFLNICRKIFLPALQQISFKSPDKSPNNKRYQQKTTNLPTIKLSQTSIKSPILPFCLLLLW